MLVTCHKREKKTCAKSLSQRMTNRRNVEWINATSMELKIKPNKHPNKHTSNLHGYTLPSTTIRPKIRWLFIAYSLKPSPIIGESHRIPVKKKKRWRVGGLVGPPIWKICASQIGSIFPPNFRDETSKNLWSCHHLVDYLPCQTPPEPSSLQTCPQAKLASALPLPPIPGDSTWKTPPGRLNGWVPWKYTSWKRRFTFLTHTIHVWYIYLHLP